MEKIDFVITWVDGSDPQWQAQRRDWLPEGEPESTACNRYRDWDLLRYWFRGVEAYAPWVNRIYFITWGHCPAWLNRNHPKLTLVPHEAYIPRDKLPTYNSNVLELYLHQLPGLCEQFVLFNDDMFLLQPVKETDFFRKGLPCDTLRLGTIHAIHGAEIFPHAMLNNCGILNRHFSKREVLKKHWHKFLSPRYGTDLIRNLLLMPFRYFSGFYDTHLPTAHLKSTFAEVWQAEGALLDRCTSHRFRSREDVTHWVMKNWRFCQGRFVPRSRRWGKCFELGTDQNVARAIRSRRYQVVCLNDSDPNLDFEAKKTELTEAFEAILPRRSGFELW